MLERLAVRIASLVSRLRRIERREVAEFRRWVENTSNLIHLSVLLFVPLLIALVTLLSNAVDQISFLLFPPLASGAYTLFSDPEGRYSSARTFVGGMTLGAFCGWIALEVSARYIYHVPPDSTGVYAGAAALSVLLTGLATWALDLELPTAFSSALLILLSGTSQLAYVIGVGISTVLISVVFVVWREQFYEQRARYLYGTTRSDDHVLVPVRDDSADTTGLFGARLAAAHEAGKLVLLDVVDDDRLAAAERSVLEEHETGDGSFEVTLPADTVEPSPESDDEAVRRAAADAASALERQARRIRRCVDVPVEIAVASGSPVAATMTTARQANCDLVVVPYESEGGMLSEYVNRIFAGPIDAVALRTRDGRTDWNRILVAVASPSDVAHAMIDFAGRLAGDGGSVSLFTCITTEVERRSAETELANLAETADCEVETRVARSSVRAFIDANASAYDLIVLGSSQERSRASRLLSPPLFSQLQDVDADLAVVDRGTP